MRKRIRCVPRIPKPEQTLAEKLAKLTQLEAEYAGILFRAVDLPRSGTWKRPPPRKLIFPPRPPSSDAVAVFPMVLRPSIQDELAESRWND